MEVLSEMTWINMVTYEVVTSYWQEAGREFGTVVTWSAQQSITIYDAIFPNVKNGLNNATLILTTKEVVTLFHFTCLLHVHLISLIINKASTPV